VVEQAEFLEDDADIAPELEQAVLVERFDTSSPNIVTLDRALGLDGEEQQAQKRLVLPAPDGPGEEMERVPGSMEKLRSLKDLRAVAVTQPDILELDDCAVFHRLGWSLRFG
jgi:hypothetical protein